MVKKKKEKKEETSKRQRKKLRKSKKENSDKENSKYLTAFKRDRTGLIIAKYGVDEQSTYFIANGERWRKQVCAIRTPDKSVSCCHKPKLNVTFPFLAFKGWG